MGQTTCAKVDILETLLEQSPLHVVEIASLVDRHPIQVDRACASLHDDQYIYPLGRGLYGITTDRRARLKDRCDS